MNIIVEPCRHAIMSDRLYGKLAVVVDVLRASSTIITAVHNGCDRIAPIEDVETAVELYKRTEGEKLLCGEAYAQKIAGFDLGNSPMEYTADKVRGKILLYCTTNGTRAIRRTFNADTVYVAGFINASATAARILSVNKDTVIACAGTRGGFSMEDTLGAGCIIDKILALGGSQTLDDLAILALDTYRRYQGNLMQILQNVPHVGRLQSLGFTADIEYCLTEDLVKTVPIYEEGIIISG